MRLYITRHAESLGNLGQSTDPNCGLSERGCAQIERLGDWLSGEIARTGQTVAAIYATPYGRCQRTAGAIARRLQMEVGIEPAFQEWPVLSWDELQGQLEPFGAPLPAFTTRSESFARVEARISEGLRRLFTTHGPEATLIVVSHAAPIDVMLRVILQAPSTLFATNNAATHSLIWYPPSMGRHGRWAVDYLNRCDYLWVNDGPGTASFLGI